MMNSISLLFTLFERPINISSDSISCARVSNCQFSNFHSNSYALLLKSQNFITLRNCYFKNLKGESSENGYYIESMDGKITETTMFDLELIGEIGGCVQVSACDQSLFTSSNVSKTDVEHICVSYFINCCNALASFVNAVNCSAKERGVGFQFQSTNIYASLQFSNFIRINSPVYGVVRSCFSDHTLYVIRCYFELFSDDQKALFGESSITVLSSSLSLKDMSQQNVSFSNCEEILQPLPIRVISRSFLTRNSARPFQMYVAILLSIINLSQYI